MDPATIAALGTLLGGMGSLFGGSKQVVQQAAPVAGGVQNPMSFQLPQKMQKPQTNLDKELDMLAQMIASATAAANPSQPQPEQKEQGKFQQMLTQLPGADSPIWALLGLTDSQDSRQSPAPIAGGPQGQLVQGFNMPQRQGIGSILASIPRANYG